MPAQAVKSRQIECIGLDTNGSIYLSSPTWLLKPSSPPICFWPFCVTQDRSNRFGVVD